ncbi:MAG: DUF1887 family protein [Clostridia bacterium]|nr:DUF1887 family protein [Clostridia bacterium]
MTAIEFFDRTPIENIISSLTTSPDKIIVIGEGKLRKKYDRIYRAFLEKRGIKTEICYKSIRRNNITTTVELLSEIVETEDECVFDLTGGDDLVLVAMGIVYQKYSGIKKIHMQRFNINNGVVNDCDNDGKIIFTGTPQITVEENIMLHGGSICYEGDCDKKRTFSWDLDADFTRDIEAMWDICKLNPGKWNSQLNVLEAIDDFAKSNPLEVAVNLSSLKEHLKVLDIKYIPLRSLLTKLSSQKLIYAYREDEENISFIYKNEQVKKCLIKSGTILELKVLIAAKKAKENNGENTYNDFMNGVYIDWDGEIHNSNDTLRDTENEIDVILMQGLTPVFISCKNGAVDDDELYKLDAVTSRFGGNYAKKVLIATYLNKKGKSLEYFRQRAKDMNILLIDGVHTLSNEKLEKIIRNLLSIKE